MILLTMAKKDKIKLDLFEKKGYYFHDKHYNDIIDLRVNQMGVKFLITNR